MVRFLTVWLFLALGATAALAQADQSSPDTTQYKVGRIFVQFNGIANVNEQVVLANMATHEGSTLDEALIDRDIRSLYKTGLFEFIEIKREILPNNVVNLYVDVTPKYRVLAIRYEGNSKVKTSRLEKEVKSRPNTALDERQVKDDSEKIFEYYQKHGYNQASVNYVIDRDKSTGFGTIIFKIREGNKVRIADIRFTGNAHIKARLLRKQMDTKRWWMFSWLTGTGYFMDDKFEDDLDKLRDYYREDGYLDVDIPRDKITFDYPTTGKMVITFQVHEGRQYHVGMVTITGNKLYPSTLLMRVLKEKTGSVFSPSKIDKDVNDMEDFYGKDGYLDTNVTITRRPNLKTGRIDLEYHIDESSKYFVESIKIEGNSKTKSVVILRELTLDPGDVFNTVSMKISKLRLQNTRFFDEQDLSPEQTNIPGRRNLKITVTEARTGNLTFGAGYSSLERAVIFAELDQSNFDLFNRRSFFQGAGQKFQLRVQVGQVSNEALLSFDEPYFLGYRLGAGFSVFRTSSDYTSTLYQEVRTGFEVHLRKGLFELVQGQLGYTYEVVGINDIQAGAPAIIESIAGNTTVSKVTLQILRDTRDKIVNTLSGNRMEFDANWAGGPFGGNENYYSFEARGSQFLPIFSTQNQTIGIIGRLGVIQEYGKSKSVPFYDLWYLGGPNDLRGFQFQDVGPKDSFGNPLGGKSYGMLSIEYSVDIVSPIRFAVFYDGGFVNESAYDFDPGNYNDDFGVGLRLFVAGAPLSLDYGIPLTGDKYNKKGGQFNFSFGTRF